MKTLKRPGLLAKGARLEWNMIVDLIVQIHSRYFSKELCNRSIAATVDLDGDMSQLFELAASTWGLAHTMFLQLQIPIVFNGRRLACAVSLKRYGIRKGCTVEFLVCGTVPNAVQLTVSTASGNELQGLGPFHSNMSVADVKRRIETQTGSPLCTQRLLFGLAILNDADYLRDLLSVSTEPLNITLVLTCPAEPGAVLAQMKFPKSIQEWNDVQDVVFGLHPALPEGWIRAWSRSHECVYYVRMIDNWSVFDINRVV